MRTSGSVVRRNGSWRERFGSLALVGLAACGLGAAPAEGPRGAKRDAVAEGRELLVRNTRLRGEEVKLVITGLVGSRPWHHYFVGTAHGDAIDGTLSVSDGSAQTVYPWHATRDR